MTQILTQNRKSLVGFAGQIITFPQSIHHIISLYVRKIIVFSTFGGVPEWPKGTDCKSAAFRFDGSNPSSPTKTRVNHLIYSRFSLVLKRTDSKAGSWKQSSGLFPPAHLAPTRASPSPCNSTTCGRSQNSSPDLTQTENWIENHRLDRLTALSSLFL